MTEPNKALDLIAHMGWNSRPSGNGDNHSVETCPFCSSTKFKFFINVSDAEKNGLWSCKACKEEGNLFQLRDRLGITTPNAMSIREVAENKDGPSPLPNFEAAHKALLTNDVFSVVLDYLVHERKFSMKIIERLKLGATRDTNGVLWFLIPYYDAAGNAVFYKARRLGEIPKEESRFRGPKGREACLYNAVALKSGLSEIVLVEGESDTISLLTQGFENVVGVPGAGVKKAAWIDSLVDLAPETIYILYDNDKTGQDNAKDMAMRIGIDKVKNVLLPQFLVKTEGGGTKPGKDINEWFAVGHTMEEFAELLKQAKAFSVEGVQQLSDVLDDLRADIEDRGVIAKYVTPWPSLNKKVGGFEDGDLVAWMAEGKVGKTTTVLNLLHYYALNGVPSMMYCQEMLPKRVVRKWCSHVTQTDDTSGQSKFTPETIDLSLEVGRNLPSDLLFAYTKSFKIEDVLNTIRQAVRRYGVKQVGFDNLQLVCRSIEHQSQETSKITKQFKELCLELQIVLHLIVQPNRVAEGQIISARNAMGSSAIEKDVDAMICLHRNRVLNAMREKDFNGILETDSTFEPQMLAKVDLGRYSAGGSCTLFMDGGTSTVRELTQNDMQLPTYERGGSIPTEIVEA